MVILNACFLHELQVVAKHSTQEVRGGITSRNIQEPISHVRYQTNNIYTLERQPALTEKRKEAKQGEIKRGKIGILATNFTFCAIFIT